MREIEFPRELHGRIMRSVYLSRFRLPLLIVNLLLGVNFFLSGWNIWQTFRSQIPAAPALAEQTLAVRFSQLGAAMFTGEAAVFLLSLGFLSIGLLMLHRLNHSLLRLRRPSSVRH